MTTTHASRIRHFGSVAGLVLCLTLAATAASAQIVSDGAVALRWDNCYGDGGGDSKSFACNTNSGSSVLVVSAIPYEAMPAFNHGEATITVKTPGDPLSNWWRFEGASCRGITALGAVLSPPPSISQCAESTTLVSGAHIGISYFYQNEPFNGGNPNAARIHVFFAIAEPIAFPAGVEVFLFRLVLNHTKSTGDGACTGCTQGLCLGINTIYLAQPISYLDNRHLLSPIEQTASDVVSWQGNFVMHADPPHTSLGTPARRFRDCLDITDTNRPTWGAIKRMYR